METQVIRALYDEQSITVYQAYNRTIAEAAVNAQTFISPPFKKERMTWIKPSFLWMMDRSGWATKVNQECILAIKIKKEGLVWALNNSCLSHYDGGRYPSYEDWQIQLRHSPVRIQWDPERDIFLQRLPYRAIQIGLTGIAVEKYLSDWILEISDITDNCRNIYNLVQRGEIDLALSFLPNEKEYDLPSNIVNTNQE